MTNRILCDQQRERGRGSKQQLKSTTQLKCSRMPEAFWRISEIESGNFFSSSDKSWVCCNAREGGTSFSSYRAGWGGKGKEIIIEQFMKTNQKRFLQTQYGEVG